MLSESHVWSACRSETYLSWAEILFELLLFPMAKFVYRATQLESGGLASCSECELSRHVFAMLCVRVTDGRASC